MILTIKSQYFFLTAATIYPKSDKANILHYSYQVGPSKVSLSAEKHGSSNVRTTKICTTDDLLLMAVIHPFTRLQTGH